MDGRHDFDFLFGQWTVHNRSRRRTPAGFGDWQEFEATSLEEPLLGGLGNLERFDAPLRPSGPLHAVAVRLYDEASGLWSIFWSTAGSGTFLTPTIGRFKNGVGTFYEREELDGKKTVVRFLWTHDGPATCRWEQAYSDDDGLHWETNWTMDFTRVT